MLISATVAILIAMCLALLRAVKGPTLFDRALAVNHFGTITILFISVFGFVIGRPEVLDIALVYALINFITLIAFLKYFELGDMTLPADEHKEQQ